MYSLTIQGLKPKQALALLEVIPSNATISVTNIGDKPPPAAPPARINGEVILGLGTGKTARPGTDVAFAVTMLEKLEKRHGVGNVNRDELTEALEKQKQRDLPKPGGVITRALKHGYIVAG